MVNTLKFEGFVGVLLLQFAVIVHSRMVSNDVSKIDMQAVKEKSSASLQNLKAGLEKLSKRLRDGEFEKDIDGIKDEALRAKVRKIANLFKSPADLDQENPLGTKVAMAVDILLDGKLNQTTEKAIESCIQNIENAIENEDDISNKTCQHLDKRPFDAAMMRFCENRNRETSQKNEENGRKKRNIIDSIVKSDFVKNIKTKLVDLDPKNEQKIDQLVDSTSKAVDNIKTKFDNNEDVLSSAVEEFKVIKEQKIWSHEEIQQIRQDLLNERCAQYSQLQENLVAVNEQS